MSVLCKYMNFTLANHVYEAKSFLRRAKRVIFREEQTEIDRNIGYMDVIKMIMTGSFTQSEFSNSK